MFRHQRIHSSTYVLRSYLVTSGDHMVSIIIRKRASISYDCLYCNEVLCKKWKYFVLQYIANEWCIAIYWYTGNIAHPYIYYSKLPVSLYSSGGTSSLKGAHVKKCDYMVTSVLCQVPFHEKWNKIRLNQFLNMYIWVHYRKMLLYNEVHKGEDH